MNAYEIGAIVLGAAAAKVVKKAVNAATPAKVSAVKAKIAKHTASATKLAATAAKLAKKNKKAGAAFQKLAAAHAKKAATATKKAATPAKQTTVAAPATPAASSAKAPASKANTSAAKAGASAVKTKVRGAVFGDMSADSLVNAAQTAASAGVDAASVDAASAAVDPDAVDAMNTLANTVATASGFVTQLQALGVSAVNAAGNPVGQSAQSGAGTLTTAAMRQNMLPNTMLGVVIGEMLAEIVGDAAALITQGNLLITQANALANTQASNIAANPDAPSDPNVVNSANTLNTSLTAWNQQAAAQIGPQGAAPAVGAVTVWAPSTKYVAGNQVTNNGNLYQATVGGTSAASGGPAGTATTPTVDGTVNWIYKGAAPVVAGAQWMPNTPYTVGMTVTNNGVMFTCLVAGTSGAAPGPQDNSSQISTTSTSYTMTPPPVIDGQVQWISQLAQQALQSQQQQQQQGGGGGGGGSDSGGGGGSDDGSAGGDDGSGGDSGAGDGSVDAGGGDDGSAGGGDDGSPGADLPNYAAQAAALDADPDDGSDSGTGDGSDLGPDSDLAATDGSTQTIMGMLQEILGGNNMSVSPDVQADLDAANANLADLQAQRYLQNQSYAPPPIVSYAPTSSGTFQQRLADSQAAMFLNLNPNYTGSNVMGHGHGGHGNIEGFEFEEPEDVSSQGWTIDITDEPADLDRRTASLHHGAAYLQPYSYPRGGASSGQEGGLMIPRQELNEGDFGGTEQHDNYATGVDVLGAGVPPKKVTPPARGFVLKTSPGGRQFTSLVVNKPSAHDHATSIKNARAAGQRAIDIANRVQATLSKMSTPAAGSTVHGAAHKKLGPAQIKLLVDKVKKIGQKTLNNAAAHEANVNAKAAAIKAGAQALSKKLTVPFHAKAAAAAKTKVKGLEAQAAVLGAMSDLISEEAILGTMEDVLGAWSLTSNNSGGGAPANYSAAAPAAAAAASVPVDPNNPPDPNNPGFLMDGTPDPNASGSSTDPTAAAGSPPTQATMTPGVDFIPDPGISTDGTQYSSTPTGNQAPVPIGAIYYDGSHGAQNWWFRSFNSYKSPTNCITWFNGHWNAAYGGWKGTIEEAVNDSGGYLNKPGPFYGMQISSASDTPTMNAASVKVGWGPMIGAIEPSRDTHGLRYDAGTDSFFWYFDTAPQWAQAPVLALRLNQQVLDYNAQQAAAAADAAASAQQDALDAATAKQQAAQQAADDAQTQHQQDQDAQQAQADAQTQSLADAATAQEQQAADESAARQQAIQDASLVAQAQAQAALLQAQGGGGAQGDGSPGIDPALAPPPDAPSIDDGGGDFGNNDMQATGDPSQFDNAMLPDDSTRMDPLAMEPTELTGLARLKAHTNY
jgi:hypothetical protein